MIIIIAIVNGAVEGISTDMQIVSFLHLKRKCKNPLFGMEFFPLTKGNTTFQQEKRNFGNM